MPKYKVVWTLLLMRVQLFSAHNTYEKINVQTAQSSLVGITCVHVRVVQDTCSAHDLRPPLVQGSSELFTPGKSG